MKYILYILLYISIFGFSFYQLKDSNFRNTIKIITSGLVSILLTSLFIWLMSFIFSDSKLFNEQRSFNSNQWKNTPTERYKMSQDLVSSPFFIGYTKKQVLDSLGLPSLQTDTTWVYYLESNKGIYYQLKQLKLTFKKDSLTQISLKSK